MHSKQNITLAIDSELLTKARIIALKRQTSLTQLIRDNLEMLVRNEDDTETKRQRLLTRLQKPTLNVGVHAWTRDELHEC
ncbi:MAG: hypothetical protein JW841_13890 [Deltaproteobacteria bacterium]|nr:hypothetical protein [Deltaproteobacteria bacterium]